jgi:hypothetical protein
MSDRSSWGKAESGDRLVNDAAAVVATALIVNGWTKRMRSVTIRRISVTQPSVCATRL